MVRKNIILVRLVNFIAQNLRLHKDYEKSFAILVNFKYQTNGSPFENRVVK